jgi:putative FmdB family regulatory protein
MPTYAYRCIKCEHEFEVFEKMSARTRARKCPVCGGRAERIISGGAGFLFKGEGFYATDYRSEEYRSSAKADKESAKPAEEKAKPTEKPAPAEKPEKKQPKKRGKR